MGGRKMTMKVVVKFVGVEEPKTFDKVFKFGQVPGALHLINENELPIAILALQNVEYVHIPQHESDIRLMN
jgi:hypothetical protein